MKHFITLMSLLVLVSCTSSAGKPLPKITFLHLQPLMLNSKTVDIRSSEKIYKIVEHFYVPVPDLFKSYGSRRFQALNNNDREVSINLENVEVSYKQVDSQNNIASFIGVARMDEYTVSMIVDLVLQNPQNGMFNSRRLNVGRIMSISEHVSIAERERRQMEGMEQLFVDLDNAIVETLINDFGMEL